MLSTLVLLAGAVGAVIIYNAVVILVARLRGKKVVFVWPSSQRRRMAMSFVPDKNNRTFVAVQGLLRAELDNILAYFRKEYGLSKSWVHVAEAPVNVHALTFPEDIFPAHLFYLVNYLRYPKGYDLERRSIDACARVILTLAFGVPDTILVGQRAMIYVPVDDTDYTVVHIKVESGAVYRISLTNLSWTVTDAARLPPIASGLPT